MAGSHLLDAGPEPELDIPLGQHLGDIVVGLVRERLQQCVAVVEQINVGGADVEVAIFGGYCLRDHVG